SSPAKTSRAVFGLPTFVMLLRGGCGHSRLHREPIVIAPSGRARSSGPPCEPGGRSWFATRGPIDERSGGAGPGRLTGHLGEETAPTEARRPEGTPARTVAGAGRRDRRPSTEEKAAPG